jgi:tetratricopeptide (TPR) repeat protein
VELQSKLRCTTEPFTGAEFTMLDANILIGSGEDCDVVIEHESIAKRHARVITEGTRVRIENVDPVAALIINGVVETRVDLNAGDTIGLGRLQFQFVAASTAVAAKPAARPVPAFVEESEPSLNTRPAWLVPALATGAVVAVAAVAFLVVPALRGPSDTVVDVSSDDASGSALATAQQHFNAARWADSIAAVDEVAADHPQAAAAAELRQRAQDELEQSAAYDQVRAHIDNGEFGQAQTALDAIPRSSYYRSRAADDGTERRILNGLIESAIVTSQDLQAAGDTTGARAAITSAQLMAPDDARLRTRLEQIDNPEANNRPVPEVVPPAEPVAVVAPPPAAVQSNTGREPAAPAVAAARPEPARPAAPAAEPAAARPTPAAPTPAPPAPAAATPRPATVDEAPTPEDTMSDSERAADLLNRARRLAINQEYADSIRLLDEAQALQPNNAQIQLLLHNNYRRIGNNLRAANAARRYLDLVPGAPQRDELEAWLSANAP